MLAGQIAVFSFIYIYLLLYFLQSQANLLTQYGHEDNSFSHIVSIVALTAHQSNQLNLVSFYIFLFVQCMFQVAITSKGVRLYFSVVERRVGFSDGHGFMVSVCSSFLILSIVQAASQQEVRVQKLRIAHVRFAPGVVPASVYGNSPHGVSIAYADQGILFDFIIHSLYLLLRNFCVSYSQSKLCLGHVRHAIPTFQNLQRI